MAKDPKKNVPVKLSKEMRDRALPYAVAIDPIGQSVAGFVQECVLAIIELIESEPTKRRVPSIVERARAGLESTRNPQPLTADAEAEIAAKMVAREVDQETPAQGRRKPGSALR